MSISFSLVKKPGAKKGTFTDLAFDIANREQWNRHKTFTVRTMQQEFFVPESSYGELFSDYRIVDLQDISGWIHELRTKLHPKAVSVSAASPPDVFQRVLDKLRESLAGIPRLDTFVEPFLREVDFGKRHDDDREQCGPGKPEIPAKAYLSKCLSDISSGSFSLIASQAGSGKTRLLRYFQHILLIDRKEPRAVIWLDQAVLAGKFKIEAEITGEALRDVITAHLGALCNDASKTFTRGVLELLTSGKAVIIIDGLDELVMRSARTSIIDAWIEALTSLVVRLGVKRVIASCRQTMLTSTSDFKNIEHTHEIVPWNKSQVRAWLSLNIKAVNPEIQDDTEIVYNKIELIEPMEEICRVPFLLRSFVEIYNDLPQYFRWSQKHEIYERLVQTKLETKAGTIPGEAGFLVKLKKKLLQIVALHYIAGAAGCMDLNDIDFLASGTSILNEEDLGKVEKLLNQGTLANLVRNGTMLEVAGEGCIFPHRSIAEYLVADLIAHNMAARGKYFFPTYFTPEAMDFLVAMLGSDDQLSVDQIVRFFSVPCHGKTENVLLRGMVRRLGKKVYTMEDLCRVFTDGLVHQREIDLSDIMVLNTLCTVAARGQKRQKSGKLLEMISKNTSITSLNLHSCDLTEFLDWISNLVQLHELDVSDNQLTTLPDSIGNLVQIQTLNLCNNKLTELPRTIGNLVQLQTLKVWDNKLDVLPGSIGNLAHLQEFNVSWNTLGELPRSIGELAQLRRLGVQHTLLTTLPDSIGNLAQLQELDVSNNQLTTLPDSIGNLAQLQTLKVTDNKLDVFPRSISNIAHLQKLDISWNKLAEIPGSIGNLAQLQVLYINGTRLTTLPDSIGNLAQLQVLYIITNRLTAIPDSIGNLAQLRELDISGNQLTTLPNSIGGLSQLQELRLTHNQLTELPDSLGNLVGLKSLQISINKLTKLPESISNLTHLQMLFIDDQSIQLTPVQEQWLNNLKAKGCKIIR